MPDRTFTLTVDGTVERPLSLSPVELLALPAIERDVSLDCGKGTRTRSTMKGPAVSLLIEMAEAKDSACRAVFHCTDGHRETMSIADLLSCEAFLAFCPDDVTANAGQPAVRLVVPGKFGERWAKFVERIEIVADN